MKTKKVQIFTSTNFSVLIHFLSEKLQDPSWSDHERKIVLHHQILRGNLSWIVCPWFDFSWLLFDLKLFPLLSHFVPENILYLIFQKLMTIAKYVPFLNDLTKTFLASCYIVVFLLWISNQIVGIFYLSDDYIWQLGSQSELSDGIWWTSEI